MWHCRFITLMLTRLLVVLVPISAYADQGELQSIIWLDSCQINFSRGIVEFEEVLLGKTSFKEIKRYYGKEKVERNRVFFSLTDGFFSLRAKLDYPGSGIEFKYYSSMNIKGQRGIFGNHKVNSIVLKDTCSCQTEDGIGLGSTYNELIEEFGEDNLSFVKINSSRMYSVVTSKIKLSSGNRIFIQFEGGDVEEKGMFVVSKIIFSLMPDTSPG